MVKRFSLLCKPLRNALAREVYHTIRLPTNLKQLQRLLGTMRPSSMQHIQSLQFPLRCVHEEPSASSESVQTYRILLEHLVHASPKITDCYCIYLKSDCSDQTEWSPEDYAKHPLPQLVGCLKATKPAVTFRFRLFYTEEPDETYELTEILNVCGMKCNGLGKLCCEHAHNMQIAYLGLPSYCWGWGNALLRRIAQSAANLRRLALYSCDHLEKLDSILQQGRLRTLHVRVSDTGSALLQALRRGAGASLQILVLELESISEEACDEYTSGTIHLPRLSAFTLTVVEHSEDYADLLLGDLRTPSLQAWKIHGDSAWLCTSQRVQAFIRLHRRLRRLTLAMVAWEFNSEFLAGLPEFLAFGQRSCWNMRTELLYHGALANGTLQSLEHVLSQLSPTLVKLTIGGEGPYQLSDPVPQPIDLPNLRHLHVHTPGVESHYALSLWTNSLRYPNVETIFFNYNANLSVHLLGNLIARLPCLLHLEEVQVKAPPVELCGAADDVRAILEKRCAERGIRYEMMIHRDAWEDGQNLDVYYESIQGS